MSDMGFVVKTEEYASRLLQQRLVFLISAQNELRGEIRGETGAYEIRAKMKKIEELEGLMERWIETAPDEQFRRGG